MSSDRGERRNRVSKKARRSPAKFGEIKFRALIENGTDVILVVDKSLRMCYASPSFERMFGIEPMGFMHKPMDEFFSDNVHPEYLDSVLEAYEGCLGNPGNECRAEFQFKHSDGTWHFLVAVGINHFNTPGVNGLVINIRDITEQKNASESLRRNEELLRAIIENVNDIIWQLDNETRVTYISPSVEKVLGYASEEVLGTKVLDYFRKEDLPHIMKNILDVERGETSVFHEYEMRAKDGSYVSIEVSSKALKNKNGDVTGFSGVSRDIRYRKRLEKEAKNYLELADVMFIAVNKNGLVTLANEKAAEILGLPVNEIISKNWFDEFIPKRLRKREKDILRNLLNGDLRELRGTDSHVLARDGSERLIRWEKTALYDDDGNITGYLSSGMDMTEFAKKDKALQATEEAFRQMFESSNVGKAIIEIDGGLRVNKAFADMLGYSLKELANTKWQEITPTEEVDEIQGILNQLISGELNSARFTKSYIRKDGGRVLADVSTVLHCDEERNAKYFITTIVDITENMKRQEALAASEMRYRRLFEAAKDGILILNAETGQAEDANPYLTDLLGYTREEIIGKKIWDIGLFKDIANNKGNFLELQRKEYVRYDDMPLQTKDGRTIDAEFVSNVYYINRIKVIQCNIRNITERKAIERMKRHQELTNEILLGLHSLATATEQELFDFCLDASLRITESGISFIGWMNADESMLTVHSWSKSAYEQCKIQAGQLHFPIVDAGLWGDCVRKRRAIIVNDYSKKHRGKKGIPAGHVPLKNLLCVPISDGNRIVAVAAVANKSSDYIEDDASSLIMLITKMWEIYRRKQHEIEIDNLNSFLQSIRNLNQEIVKEEDFDRLLNTSCRLLTEIRGYIDVSIAFINARTGEMVSRAHYGRHGKDPWRYSPEVDREVPPCIIKVMGENSSVILDKKHSICADCTFCAHEEPHQSILVPMRGRNGELMGIISACLDMGRAIHPQEVPLFEEVAGDLVFAYEKHEGESALRESEKNLRIAEHLAKLGSWSWNRMTRELFLSDEMYNIIGLERNNDALDFSKHEPYYTPESWKRFHATTEKTIRTGEPYEVELDIVSKDGTRRRMVSRGEAIKGDNGEVIGLRGTLQDITERKLAEDEIRTQLEELKRWHDVMLDREDRIQELKREVNDLCRRAGENPRYSNQEGLD